MRAKACVRCRQWKIGCDADAAGARGCTRCRDANLDCTYDSSFRRTPKRQKLAELQSELAKLRELTGEVDGEVAGDGPSQAEQSPAMQGQSRGDIPLLGQSSVHSVSTTSKSIGDVDLTPAQYNELFRVFFTRCHPHLPMSMSRSAEGVHQRCPLLFWVICAASSLHPGRMRFEGHIRVLASQALLPAEATVETVQALLILCVWPFDFISQHSDPSFVYGGIATQLALQIGLSRPAIDLQPEDVADGEDERKVRETTWMACFMVNQILSSRLGVPTSVQADFSLLSSLDNANTPPTLARLCWIAHLTVEASHALGARASNFSGLLDPAPRISLILAFVKQLDDYRRQHFPAACDIEDLFFLGSMLQLLSFALHDDVPITSDSMYLIQRAKDEAIRLIQVACEKNLTLLPYYTSRSVCHAALVLHQIKLSQFTAKNEPLDDYIQRAKQSLSVRENPNMAQFVASVTSLGNPENFSTKRKRAPLHRWKMGASLFFDSRRTYIGMLQSDLNSYNQIIDLDGFLFDS